MFKNKLILLILLLALFSCQKTEVLKKIVFDFDQFKKININAEKKTIVNFYASKFDDPYIDHSLEFQPINFLQDWFGSNINIFGSQNNFTINILDSSLKKLEIPNVDAKKYEDKLIFKFDLNFIVEFVLYDDFNLILASSLVEINRTTTSRMYISLEEMQKIIDKLIFDSLLDFSIKTEDLLNLHMNNYIL